MNNKFRTFLCLILLVAVFATISTTSAYAEDLYKTISAKVGLQPVAIIPHWNETNRTYTYDTLNVVCLGYDADFNGVLDEGDEAPSWWQVSNVVASNPFNEGNTNNLVVKKIMDLPANFGGLFPYRFGRLDTSVVSDPMHILPIPTDSTLMFYDMVTGKQVSGAIIKNNGSKSTTFFRSNQQVITAVTSRDYASPTDWIPTDNWLRLFDANHKLLYSTRVPSNNIQRVVHLRAMNKSALAVLCEGNGYPGISRVYFYKFKDGVNLEDVTQDTELADIFDTLSINAGLGANDMVVIDNSIYPSIPLLYVVASSNNELRMIDYVSAINATKPSDVNTTETIIPTSTPGAKNAIRDISFVRPNPSIPEYVTFISSYDEKVYYIKGLPKGMNYDRIAIPSEGPVETVLGIMYNNILCAHAVIYKTQSYDPNNLVSITYVNTDGINDTPTSTGVYPNPATNFITIDNPAVENATEVNLLDINGNALNVSYVISGSSMLVNLPVGIASGNYFIKLITPKGDVFEKIIVQ